MIGNELMIDNEIWTFSVESILAKFVRKKVRQTMMPYSFLKFQMH